MKLSLKLPLAFAWAQLFLFCAALFGIYSLNQSLGTFENAVAATANTNHEAQVADMALVFKTQVLEWKNVLLRGSNAEKMNTHWAGFVQHERDVAERAKKLMAALPEGESRALVAKFAQAHTQMGENYRKGLEFFKAANMDPAGGDNSAQDMDREPLKLLEQAVARIKADNAAVLAHAAASGRQRNPHQRGSHAAGVRWWHRVRYFVEPKHHQAARWRAAGCREPGAARGPG